MRKFALGIGAVAVLAAAAAYGLLIYPTQQFRTALDASLLKLPGDVTASYKTADYSLVSGRATMTGVVLHATGSWVSELPIDEIPLVKPSLHFPIPWAPALSDPTASTV